MSDESPPMPSIDDGILLRHVSAAAFAAGMRYAHAGEVLSRRVEKMADGKLRLLATVRGTAAKPYRQDITLTPTQRGFSIGGRCSCPVGWNCKHVAAALLASRSPARGLPIPGLTPAAPSPQPRELALEPEPAPPVATPPTETLPDQLREWLRDLEEASLPDTEAYPPNLAQRLYYVLGVKPEYTGINRPLVTPMSVNARKDGSLGTARPYNFGASANPPRHFRPSDLRIVPRLAAMRHNWSLPKPTEDWAALLRLILGTGRARWGAMNGPDAREGAPARGRIGWHMTADGSQRATLELPEGLLPLALPEPWYADPATGQLGPVETGLPAPIAAALLAAPPVPPGSAPLLAAEMSRRLPHMSLPRPAEPAPPEQLRGPPVPHLLLTRVMVPAHALPALRRFGYGVMLPVPAARLGFTYGPTRVPPADHAPPRTFAAAGRLFHLTRDARAEQAAERRLRQLQLNSLRSIGGYMLGEAARAEFVIGDGSDAAPWLDVVLNGVPRLVAEGWVVEQAPDFPLRLAKPDGDIAARLSDSSGIDWLELELGVLVDGQRIDLVPRLVGMISKHGDGLAKLLEREERMLLLLDDGRHLVLPSARILPIVQALTELYDRGGMDATARKIGFSRLDAAEMVALEERAGITFEGGEALRALGRQLREAGDTIPPVTLPPGFTGTLRPYQAEGVAWLQFLNRAGLGGVLADDMGLGKTVQTLAHLAIEKAEGRLDRPALIVCPTSLIPNWLREAGRFTPGMRVLPLHGRARLERFGEIVAHDIVLSTYPLLTRDRDKLAAQEWHAVILDEAQTIKNPNAETTRQARQLKARQRLCLSGTPLQNHLGELWSIFDFLAPGFLGGSTDFRARYRTPIEKHGDAARQAGLSRRVRPFLLRRTKAEVVRDLPPKTEILEEVELEAGQRAMYEAVRLAMHGKVREAIAAQGLSRSGIVILDALLKMRQACCDPRLLKLEAARKAKAGSAKLERLMELLAVLLEEGRRVVVFSQFTSMLALIATELDGAGVAFETLTGKTRDRDAPVRRFQAGEVPVFLVSLKAGGVGLNLTAADTVVHYDPWWNPAAEDQATDRAHRIGQEKPVFVHRMVALRTIEQKMERLKERKRALVAAVLDAEGGGALRLTEADVEELFAPG